MHSKSDPHYIIFLSLILFLFFKQSISKHEIASDHWVKDSSLVSQESNAEEIPIDENKIKEKKIKKEKNGAFSSIDSLLHLSYVIEKNPTIPSEIKEGCKKGDYPRVCEAATLSFVKDTDNIDASTLYYSSTQALQQALDVAKVSLQDKRTLGVDEKVSGVCEQVYADALHALKDALKASVEKDRYMVLLHLSAVITNIETCQESVPNDTKSKLQQVNIVLWRLSANAISLAPEAIN